MTAVDLARCPWAGRDPLMVAYHDQEWGTAYHDDRELFERLMLEGFQAGLSWATILRKRANFRRAFDDWEPAIVAAYGPDRVAALLADAGIVRSRPKIEAAVRNARGVLEIQGSHGSFNAYVWSFAGPARPAPPAMEHLRSRSPESDSLARDLKRRGFGFVGATTCYAFMQSVGIVNDHVAGCFRAAEG